MNINISAAVKSLKSIKPYAILSLIPLVFCLILGYTYSGVFIENIPIAIYDMDNSAFSREIAEELNASDGLNVIGYIQSQEEVEKMILSEEAYGVVVIPDNFSGDLNSGKNPGMMCYINGANFLICNNCNFYVADVINRFNDEIKLEIMEGRGVAQGKAEAYGGSLNFVDRYLYNPQMSYMQYFMPGIVCILVQQSFLACMASLLISNKHLPAERRRSGKDLAGVIASYIIFSMAGLVIGFISLHTIFNLTLRGSMPITLLLQAVFLVALTGVALTMAAFFKDEAHCVEFIMLFAVPTLLMSGYVWPVYMMPPGFMAVQRIIWPLCYFAPAVRNLQLKGIGLEILWGNIVGGLIFAAVWIPLGIWLYRRCLRTKDETFPETVNDI